MLSEERQPAAHMKAVNASIPAQSQELHLHDNVHAVNHHPSTTTTMQTDFRSSPSHAAPSSPPSTSSVKFGISPTEINELLDAKTLDALMALGGIKELARKLRTSLKNGISPVYDEKLGIYQHEAVTGAGPRTVAEPISRLDHPITTTERKNVEGDELVDLSSTAAALPLPEDMPTKLEIAPSKTLTEDPNAFADRIKVFGNNTIPPPKQVSFLAFAFEALKDRTLITSFAPKRDPVAFVDGLAIVIAVAVIVCISAANDYRKQAQFRKLNEYSRTLSNTQVIRDGVPCQLPTSKLLVGDVCHISAGDIVPADAITIQSFNLSADESSLTGESLSVSKDTTRDPFLLSGTRIVDGVGRMVVIATGPNSINGRLMASLDVEPEATPLQVKLGKLADQIGKFGLLASVFLVVGLLIVYTIFQVRRSERQETVKIVNDVINVFIIGITLVVVAIPEGLPLAVTISLAHATLRMLKDNNLVRHLKACETMGNATTVCSDKTGTLTQNRMTVVAGRFACHDFELTHLTTPISTSEAASEQNDGSTTTLTTEPLTPSRPIHPITKLPSLVPNPVLAHLSRGINVNTTAEQVTTKKGTEFIGSKTEIALLEFTQSLGFPYAQDRVDAEVLSVIPFSSERKRMSTIVKWEDGDNEITSCLYGHHDNDGFPRDTPPATRAWLYCKGASEIVLGYCEYYVDEMGRVQRMSESVRRGFEELVEEMAGKALRTICVAFKGVVSKSTEGSGGEVKGDGTEEKGEDEFGLIAATIVGIEDPIRPEVPDAVAQCHRAGIVVRMVTGDNSSTARSIAMKANILSTPQDLVLEGPHFRTLPEASLTALIPRLRVLARSSPLDKQILVKHLKKLGETVAVTGDGTNDAPALRSADVGFSMGIAGTEVAKEASDIVLLDDNFVSLCKAIMWGRSVFYDSVRKFLQFQLTVNVTAVTINQNTPYSILSAVQLLWHLQVIVCLGLYLVGSRVLFTGHIVTDDNSETGVDGTTTTMVFNTFVMCQVFNEFNARVIGNSLNVFEGVFRNPFFCGIVVGTIVVQAVIVEFGGAAFKTVPLALWRWGVCVALGVGCMPFAVLIRLTPDSILKGLGKKKGEEGLSAEEIAMEARKAGEEGEGVVVVLDAEGVAEEAGEAGTGGKRGTELWERARDVRKQVGVVNAFRGVRRDWAAAQMSERRSMSSRGRPEV
ncbi:hypothetical protein BC829DRAFT_388842 [Chytridium lagenaria]|nr:hypothetical protein BC829DRAFT_388842 [Chytridium lagenaria]